MTYKTIDQCKSVDEYITGLNLTDSERAILEKDLANAYAVEDKLKSTAHIGDKYVDSMTKLYDSLMKPFQQSVNIEYAAAKVCADIKTCLDEQSTVYKGLVEGSKRIKEVSDDLSMLEAMTYLNTTRSIIGLDKVKKLL